MAEHRRSLIEGLTTIDAERRQQAEEFVYGKDAEQKPAPAPQREPEPPKSANTDILPQFLSRAPLTTRVRPEIATALKRASLTRQLQGQEPYHVQEIMEQALVDWLRGHGYLA
jgi:hypothetical protein